MYPKQAKEDMSWDFFFLWSHVSLLTLPWRIRPRHRHRNHRYCMVLACGHAALLGMWRGEHLGGPWGRWKQIRSNQGSFVKEVCTTRLKKKYYQGWCEEIKCERICLHFIQIYYEILFIQHGFQSSVFFQPSHILTWIWWIFQQFLQVFLLNFAPFLRMASSIASPATLGRSYASGVQPKLRNFGDLTLVKKPGNGQWRWLAQRVLFGAYQVSWDRSWFRWWMMNDGMFFFLGGGGDAEDGGWGWWGWRFPMPFRSWPEEMKKNAKTRGIHQSEAAMSLLEDFVLRLDVPSFWWTKLDWSASSLN